jgi:anthranilate/para-aminobenzoate synthase component I
VVAGDGDIELALPIRTAWRAGSRLEFAAGCGIVWESKPEAEERESRLKVTRWLDLVGSAV